MSASGCEIWKFEIPIDVDNAIDIEMPTLVRPLDVQASIQNGKAYLWAAVDAGGPKERQRFRLFATGQALEAVFPLSETYVATFQVTLGTELGERILAYPVGRAPRDTAVLVFHLFHVGPTP